MIIYNKHGVAVGIGDGIIESVEETVFSPKVSSVGSYEVSLAFNGANVRLYSPGNFINTEHGDYIILKTEASADRGILAVSARDLREYLRWAVISDSRLLTGTAEELIFHLIGEYASAVFPGDVILEESDAGGAELQYSLKPGSVLQAVSTLCSLGGVGLSVRLAERGSSAVRIRVMPVRDVRRGQAGRVVLSEQFENITGASLVRDYSEACNSVLVRGERREDGTYFKVWVTGEYGDGAPDIGNRAAYYIGRTPIGDFRDGASFDGSGYLASLAEEGRAWLEGRRGEISFQAELTAPEAERILPGDLCSLRSDALGVLRDALCTQKKTVLRGGQTEHTATLAVQA